MKIVHSDPVEELQELIKTFKVDRNASHISLTKGEMRSILNHANAIDVFPTFINDRAKKLKNIQVQRERIDNKLETDLQDNEKQPFFDKKDNLDKQEFDIISYVPHEIRENGITFRVSMS